MGFFDKIKEGLAKTRKALSSTLDEVFTGYNEIDDDFYDELEETLILADLGVDTATRWFPLCAIGQPTAAGAPLIMSVSV